MNLNINNEKKFKCDLCVYKTDFKCDFKKHKTHVHDKIKAYKCDQCDFMCSTNINLQTHIMIKHSKIKNFECNQCKYTCSTKGCLQTHIKSIHDLNKDFKCDECIYECSTIGDLNKHINYVHRKIKNFKCDKCIYACSTIRILKQHINSVHERPEESKKMSIGEFSIFTILTKYNVDFKKEFKFPDLISQKNGILRFDFGIYNTTQNSYLLIEFDGQQHFKKVKWTKDDTEQQIKERFEYLQLCDKQKDQYVKDNNHHLLRIKYDDKDIEIKILEFLLSNQIVLKLG